MADEIERLLVRVEANAETFERQIRQMNKALYGAEAQTRRTLNNIKKEWKDAGRNVARDFYQPIQLASTVALGAIVGFSVNAAKRAEAVDGAFKQVFRDMPTEAQKAVTAVATEFGRLETDVKDNFSQLRSVLTALGVEGAESLKIVDQLQRRSLDIAAFGNVADAEAFRAVISGITGETEPLKRFGIVVNETATKAELLRLGFKGNAEQASEGAKAIARANLILKQSAEMHGQVARESDQLAEQEKRTRAEFTKAAEDFGKKFLPVAKDVLVWAGDALDAFNDLPDGVQTAGLALLAFVAASGPVGAAITGIRSLIAAAIAAKAAMAAIGGPNGGAAGRNGGLVGGVGRGVLGRAGLGGVLLTGLASFAPAPPRDDAPAQEKLDYALRYQKGATGYIATLRAQAARERRTLEQMRTLTQGSPDDHARDALNQLGDFGLSAAQRNGTGIRTGGGGGRGAIQSEADKLNDLRRDLAALQDDLLTDTERAAKELAEKLATIKAAVEAGLATPEQARRMEGDLYGQDIQAPEPMALDDFDFSAVQDLGRAIEEWADELERGYREAGELMARDIVDVLASGNIWEAAGYRFREAAFNGLQALLSDVFTSLLRSQAAGDGGFGSSLIKGIGSFFGGGRATGGPVTKGRLYRINENTPNSEYFLPGVSGSVLTNGQVRGLENANSVRQQPAIVKLFVEEGVMFAARVEAISGQVSVQATGAGIAYSQDQARTATMRRRQSLVG